MKNTNYHKCFHTELKLLRLIMFQGRGSFFLPIAVSMTSILYISTESASTPPSQPWLPCPPLLPGQIFGQKNSHTHTPFPPHNGGLSHYNSS